jgi:HTH-type transcriptional regulator, sugar sensing transcriptional regulator
VFRKSMNYDSLRDAGLTDGEIKVYVGLLELGSSTAGPIVRKSGVAKSIVYQILEKLIQKGLVSYIVKEKTKYFEAGQPNKLLDYIDERDRELHENRTEVESLIPQLFAKIHGKGGSTAKIFEGFKGMISVHEHTYDILKKGDEFFYFGIPSEQPEHFHLYWQRDHLRRVKAGIKVRMLFHPDTPKEVLINRNSYKGCDSRYMPVAIDTPAWFMGYKDVAVLSIPSSKPITIEIQNEEIARSFKSFFESYWKKSKVFVKGGKK